MFCQEPFVFYSIREQCVKTFSLVQILICGINHWLSPFHRLHSVSLHLLSNLLRSLSFEMYALSKLNKQNEQTWVNLQKRLNEVQFPYDKLFATEEVHDFVKNKALSVGSCEGYFIPSLLTTMAYVLAANQATVQTVTHTQPLNIFTIFVGYPGTGKLFAFALYLQLPVCFEVIQCNPVFELLTRLFLNSSTFRKRAFNR